MLLTSSKDSTMKVFVFQANIERRENSTLEFDRSAKQILSINSLSETHVVARLKNSGFVDIWNVSEGKLENTLTIDENSPLADLFVVKNNCIVALLKQERSDIDKKPLTIKIFSFDSKVKI